VPQREPQQSEAEELDNNKSHNKARKRNLATKSQQGETGELGNESHNKSRPRDWAISRATSSRGREAVPQGEPHQVEPEGLGNN
jgi:hypothetical protein